MISAPPAPVRPTVLLVDDDPAVTNALEFSLELEGFDVHAYRDGDTLLAQRPLPQTGCLVVDYHLPGMDGLHLLERLRAAGVRLPAILITTNPREALRRRAADAGVPIIEKPLLTDALLDCVRDVLERPAPVSAATECSSARGRRDFAPASWS